MKAVFLRTCILGLAVTLASCATAPRSAPGPAPGIDVTRFHLSQPFARAAIAVDAAHAADRNSPDFPAYRASVERQLARLGWTIVTSGAQSEQIALIDVEQGSRAALAQRSTIGGGARIGAGSGASDLVTTLLEVSIRRRSDATVFWEGRADMEARAGSPGANRVAAVERLAQALFRDFPGESGRTIRLP
ncbi:MAG TPA: DUF4136 domain-containing protein [Allosphingosinicella sp.]|nr:DUF4136 domain-containing protein [Allosphingosinicella sp.]